MGLTERLTVIQVGALLSRKCKEVSCTQLYSELRNHTNIHIHPYTKVLLLIILLLLIFNQILDVACIVLGTTIEVGGIGSTKLGMGNILNILISRAQI